MEYWRGFMNWPIAQDWACEICNTKHNYSTWSLTWGMCHAECRCNICHATYRMRDTNGEIVFVPILSLQFEYINLVKRGWVKYKTPYTCWEEKIWDELIKERTKL